MKSPKLILAISLLLFVSCTKTIEFKGKITEPVNVVNCIIIPDHPIEVKIGKSHSQLQTTNNDTFKNDTRVFLFENGEQIEELAFQPYPDTVFRRTYYSPYPSSTQETSYSLYKVFKSELHPQPEKEYQLQIEINGEESISAYTTMPPAITQFKADTLLEITEDDDLTKTSQQVVITINDPENFTNYYNVNFTSLTIEAYHLNEDTIYIPSNHYSKYAEPLDPIIKPNITDDLLSSSFMVNQNFSDGLFSGERHQFHYEFGTEERTNNYHRSSNWDNPYDSCRFHIYFATLSSMSHDLYLYETTCREQVANDQFSEPVQVYSNIENGVGIFGASALKTKMFYFMKWLPDEVKQMIDTEHLDQTLQLANNYNYRDSLINLGYERCHSYGYGYGTGYGGYKYGY